MDRENYMLYRKGALPIAVKDLCALINDGAELLSINPDLIIPCLSFGLYYKPKVQGFLQICGSDDNGVIKRIQEGGAAALTDHGIKGIPCIIVNDLTSAVFNICKWLYQAIDLPAVVVSGSVGKTTVKRMINAVLSERMRLFTINESRNTLKDLCCFIQNVKVRDELVLWEVSENRKNEIEYSSMALKPHIAVITNIGNSHIGTIEGGKAALLKSFQSITAGMSEGDFVIINADDHDSRQICFDRKSISVGIRDLSADCVAFNIADTKKGTSFDLCFQNQVTHIDLSVFGEHNVYNAMMAFVVGILQGIDRKTAASALRKYYNVGFRQNILRLDGVIVYADCYNASAKSVDAAIQCFCSISGIHGKRIAILGDIAEIEGYEDETYRKVAQTIDKSTLDIVVTYGKESAMIHNYVTQDIELYHCTSSDELDCQIKRLKSFGKNAYLIKGSRSMRMEQNLRHCFPWHFYLMRAVEKITIKYRWGE